MRERKNLIQSGYTRPRLWNAHGCSNGCYVSIRPQIELTATRKWILNQDTLFVYILNSKKSIIYRLRRRSHVATTNSLNLNQHTEIIEVTHLHVSPWLWKWLEYGVTKIDLLLNICNAFQRDLFANVYGNMTSHTEVDFNCSPKVEFYYKNKECKQIPLFSECNFWKLFFF